MCLVLALRGGKFPLQRRTGRDVETFRALFDVPGWKNYSLALTALLISGLALGLGKISGGEWVAALAAVGAIFGAADVSGKWVTSKSNAPNPLL